MVDRIGQQAFYAQGQIGPMGSDYAYYHLRPTPNMYVGEAVVNGIECRAVVLLGGRFPGELRFFQEVSFVV